MLLCQLIILSLSFLPFGISVSVRLLVPQAVRAGTSTILVCQFDLQGQQLYSVKWYRGNYEFFRFIPKDIPPGKSFKFPGINVDEASSSAHQVVLLKIPGHVGGRFSCEVSAEGPRFTTASDYAELHVIDVRGMRKPEIHLSSNFYDVNNLKRLSINCTSHPTLPPPTINFLINNVKVKADYIDIINPSLSTMSYKAVESWIELQRALNRVTDQSPTSNPMPESPLNNHRESDKNLDEPLWIRCETTLSQVYHLSSSDVPLFPPITVPDISPSISRAIFLKVNNLVIFLLFITTYQSFDYGS